MKIFDLLKRSGVLSLVGGISLFFLFIFLRQQFISPWLLYSDSYKFLLIARSFAEFQSPLDMFPQISWPFETILAAYKWLYPLTISAILSIFTLIGGNDTNQTIQSIAHAITITASALIPFIVARIVNRETNSSILSVISFCIVGFSGAQLIWSGFIVTEQLALATLLLALYTHQAKQKPLTILLVLLSILARPEMILAVLLLLPSSLWSRVSENIRIHLSTILTALFVLTLVLLATSTAYLTTYRFLDITTLLLLGGAVTYALYATAVKHPIVLTIGQIKILTLTILFSYAYYQFEPSIERYAIILLPLLTISALIIVQSFKPNDIGFMVIRAIGLIASITQAYSIFSYPVRTELSYHSEISISVIDYAQRQQYTELYVPQPDSFLFHAHQTELTIQTIKDEKIAEIGYNTLIVQDASYPYRGIQLHLTEKDYALIETFTAHEPFKVNNVIIENSPVTLWSKKSPSQ